MSVTDTNDVLWAELRAAYDRLAAPGLLGVHQRFEATEIVAFRPGRKPPLNALTILVAEEGDPLESLFLTGINGPKLLHIPLLKEWGFGIFRYRLGIDELGRHLDALSSSTEWSPSGKALEIGAMKAVPLHFVPADGLGPVPLNRILKNNFGTGAYVLEWAAPGSPALQPFFDEPQRLQQLSEAIGRFIPINLAGLSDRLGSICVQIPVTAVAVAIAHSADDRIVGEIAWHPAVPPRAVRVTCEFEFDNTVRGYGSVETQQGQFQLPARSDRGLHRYSVWDLANEILLAASGEQVFTSTIALTLQPISPEPRTFKIPDDDGNLHDHRVRVIGQSLQSIIGRSDSDDTGGATRRRMYNDEVARLKRERRFVQYKPNPQSAGTVREEALADLRYLINTHGRIGCWLWDPFLDADDLLQTLFHCEFSNAEMRALTAAQTHEENAGSKAQFISMQRARLEQAKGNCHGLQLEYRARTGSAGWRFHDRFLIFPRQGEAALTWSLGTSVNGFGKAHHILQQASDGQLIADAFVELWNELAAPGQLIWKVP